LLAEHSLEGAGWRAILTIPVAKPGFVRTVSGCRLGAAPILWESIQDGRCAGDHRCAT
jgi:hypothetical protein